MAKLMRFHDRPLPKACRYREFAPWQLQALAGHFQVCGCRDAFQAWLDANPQRQTRHNLQTLSLMTDSGILFDAARGCLHRPEDQLRWNCLDMMSLSDRQLLLVVVDNLVEVQRSLRALRRLEVATSAAWDGHLTSIIHNLHRTARRIEHLLDPVEGQVLMLPLKEESAHE